MLLLAYREQCILPHRHWADAQRYQKQHNVSVAGCHVVSENVTGSHSIPERHESEQRVLLGVRPPRNHTRHINDVHYIVHCSSYSAVVE